MTEPSYLRNLRAITRANPKFEHIEALERELYASESDRATVVMFGAFVETHLERYLASKLRSDLSATDYQRMFEGNGPVATFSAKILLGYGLGLLGQTTRRDLDLIRHLRNGFAHSRMPFGFDAPEVRAVCKQLKIVEVGGSTIPNGYLQRVSHDKLEAASDINDPKTRFISACHSLSYRMLYAKEGPREGDSVFPNDQPLP